MTIAGWVLFALFAFIIGAFAVGAFMEFDSVAAKSISVIVGVILIFAFFEQLNGMNVESEEWLEKFEKIDDRFRVYKVKDHSFLAIGEKIGFLSVVEIQE